MLKEAPAASRQFKTDQLEADLVIVGGGLAGTCGAITAARAGITVILVQDRPVLGGNASSEVRLWILGATSHMNNNNRWAREGGVLDEILVENTYRNPEGNPLILDTIVLEKVVGEPNIRLLLNTAVFEVSKQSADQDKIEAVRAFCSQNSTLYHLKAPLFCDASGDGVVGFLAGAAFRMGAEAASEFGEKFAPGAEYGELLGHSLYFYSKDAGRPVRFLPPGFALPDITRIPRFKSFNAREYGCRLWWIEYGGRRDTVHDTEEIKWELWRVVYGVWNYIKNSGQFPEALNLSLEWVGHIPGKRESRRFEGPYMLTQQDVVEQRLHYDAVAYGGWSLDLHPADGVFSEKPGCNQWHSRGIYQIPYRCLYSRNIKNLFLAGRIISASHVAFASTRVMATCANSAQAAGLAAAICARRGLLPADLSAPAQVGYLQQQLLGMGQYIPGLSLNDPADLTRTATLAVSSRLMLDTLRDDGPPLPLQHSWAQLLPVAAGTMPSVSFWLDVAAPTTLQAELRTSTRPDSFTPSLTLARQTLELEPGPHQPIRLDFERVRLDQPQYLFVCLLKNEQIRVHTSRERITGLLSLANRYNQPVSASGEQTSLAELGVEEFELWCPLRRPQGYNLAMTIQPPLDVFGPLNLLNGLARPTCAPNAWVAAREDPDPTLTLAWPQPQTIARLELSFDTDFDHPMESVLEGHPERVMPYCTSHYVICDGATGQLIYEQRDNHQSRNTVILERPVTTDRLNIHLYQVAGEHSPGGLFEVRCYPQ